MDNITHSLVGYLVARSLPKPDVEKFPKYESAVLWTALIASNLPDFDFLIQIFNTNNPMQYLLHHRGYTHTFLLTLPLGLIAARAAVLISGTKAKAQSALWRLSGVGVLCVLLHIGGDYCNNYGVHPFSPFYNRWYYGDFLFILEPFIWLTLLPFVFFSVKTKSVRTVSVILCALILGIVWSRQFNALPVALVVTIWFGLVSLSHFFAPRVGVRPRNSVIIPWTGFAIVFFSFFFGSNQSKNRLIELFQDENRILKREQISLSPSPANPFCWSFIITGIEEISDRTHRGKFYVAKAGAISLWPAFAPPTNCYLRTKKSLSFADSEIDHPISNQIHWVGAMIRPLDDFLRLEKKYCRFGEFLKFSRVPGWFEQSGTWYVTDLRFDGAQRKGFFTFTLNGNDLCQSAPSGSVSTLTPWIPPIELSIGVGFGI